jgi:hypothetical protein
MMRAGSGTVVLLIGELLHHVATLQDQNDDKTNCFDRYALVLDNPLPFAVV